MYGRTWQGVSTLVTCATQERRHCASSPAGVSINGAWHACSGHNTVDARVGGANCCVCAIGMSHDPYHDYEREIKQALGNAETLSRDAPFDASARKALENTLDSLRQDLSDVQQTVNIVEQSDSERFGIDVNELARRKMFIAKCERELKVGLMVSIFLTRLHSNCRVL